MPGVWFPGLISLCMHVFNVQYCIIQDCGQTHWYCSALGGGMGGDRGGDEESQDDTPLLTLTNAALFGV